MHLSFKDDRLGEELQEEDGVQHYPFAELLGPYEAANGGTEKDFSDGEKDLFTRSRKFTISIYRNHARGFE